MSLLHCHFVYNSPHWGKLPNQGWIKDCISTVLENDVFSGQAFIRLEESFPLSLQHLICLRGSALIKSCRSGYLGFFWTFLLENDTRSGKDILLHWQKCLLKLLKHLSYRFLKNLKNDWVFEWEISSQETLFLDSLMWIMCDYTDILTEAC